jgi:hypothetical protein
LVEAVFELECDDRLFLDHRWCGEGLDRWREIGVGFTSDKGGTITVLLDALPVTGKLVAEIISGETPSLDIQLLNPDRYT